MIDLFCPHCGEPWDNDELHVEGVDYREAFLAFKAYGCPVAEAVMDGNGIDHIYAECARDSVLPEHTLGQIRMVWSFSDYADDFAANCDVIDWYSDPD